MYVYASWECCHKSYLMPLRISIPQPHLGIDPLILRVIRSPYWVVVTWHLMKLNGYGHDISIAPDVKQS